MPIETSSGMTDRRYRQTDKYRQTDRPTYTDRHIQTDIHIGRQTDRQTEKKTNMFTHNAKQTKEDKQQRTKQTKT